MRTLIDLPDDQASALDAIALAEKKSRAALIREAVASYLENHRTVSLEQAFGLWSDRGEDGLAYQERIRREW